jgi:hypothetical protein
MSLNDANKCLHEFLIEGLVVYGTDSARGMIMAAHARMAHGSSIFPLLCDITAEYQFFFWKAMLPRQVRWVVPTTQTQYRQHLLVVTPPFRTTSLYLWSPLPISITATHERPVAWILLRNLVR